MLLTLRRRETRDAMDSGGDSGQFSKASPEIDGKFEIEKRSVLFRFTSFDAALRFSRDVVDLASPDKVSVMVVVVTV
jgi:hypothetical protein